MSLVDSFSHRSLQGLFGHCVGNIIYVNYNKILMGNVNSRACPECRVTSDFVCPSMYWVDTKEEKEKLIKDYKGALR
jgi:hypothetical protein